MEKKSYRCHIEFKANSDQTGQFAAEFATLNVIDHDGDVTLPGAFQDGQEVLIEAWNHNYGELPVGKAVIHEEGDKAVADGQFFLDTVSGMEHYKVAKNLGALQEWSYTFLVEEHSFGKFEEQEVQFLRKLDTWGIAQVERGAGIDTRTTSIKGRPRDEEAEDAELADDDEGEAGDGKPSGVGPEVIIAYLNLIEGED